MVTSSAQRTTTKVELQVSIAQLSIKEAWGMTDVSLSS